MPGEPLHLLGAHPPLKHLFSRDASLAPRPGLATAVDALSPCAGLSAPEGGPGLPHLRLYVPILVWSRAQQTGVRGGASEGTTRGRLSGQRTHPLSPLPPLGHPGQKCHLGGVVLS